MRPSLITRGQPLALLVALVLGLSPHTSDAQTTAPAAPPPAETLRTRLDEYMRALVDAQGFSGTVLVARGGEPIFQQAYGAADVAGRVPNTLSTRFRIGSITKPITALAILRLQERGSLSTADPICKFVAPCPDAWQPVTVHHLLSHTSGIRSFTSLPDYAATMHVATTPMATAARVSAMPLEFPPGDRFKYSNTGYVLLGAIIEKASGQPYARYIAAQVLEPLGMRDTGYESDAVTLAVGYTRDGATRSPARPIHPTVPYAAGALYSTAGDLLKLDRAIAERKLLTDATWKTMLTPVKDTYAYGWVVETQPGGRVVVSHGGGINGFATSFSRVVDQDMAVVVLRNQEDPVTFARTLAAVALGEPYTLPKKRVAATVDPALYDAYAGEYELRPGFVLTVRRDGTRLLTQATGQAEIEAFPETPTEFFLTVVDAQIRFVKDVNGVVTGLVLTQNGRETPAKKK